MSGRTPLRIRLSAAMLALVAVALAVIGVGSVSVLRDYLITRTDWKVAILAHEAERRLAQGPAAFTRIRVPPEGRVEIRDGMRQDAARAGRRQRGDTAGARRRDLPGARDGDGGVG